MWQRLLMVGLLLGLVPLAAGAQELRIDSRTGRIEFFVGESVFFRTTGVFHRWQGTVAIDSIDIPASRVQVAIETASVDTRDPSQDAQLRGPDFFDVARFPSLIFASRRVERVGAQGLRITGDVTLRGITNPMVLDVEVLQGGQRPGAAAASFTASGRIKRSQFGMTKHLDVTGDTVEIRIKADAVR